ncbi:MAG: hypothetical protein J4400_02035 [Candidatus Aenigmarchaeota archaeon]|nr:hypothetical protein [Candidatus Aenigmarchaeota archaeon]
MTEVDAIMQETVDIWLAYPASECGFSCTEVMLYRMASGSDVWLKYIPESRRERIFEDVPRHLEACDVCETFYGTLNEMLRKSGDRTDPKVVM